MKLTLAVSVFLVLSSSTKSQDKPFNPDETISEIQQQRKDLTASLRTLRNKSDATKAAPKLTEQGQRIIALEKVLGQYEAKLTGREKRDYITNMTRKHLAKHEEISRDFAAAITRLEMEYPEAYNVLKANPLVRQFREDCLERIRTTLADLDHTVQIYMESEGKAPKSLRLAVESVYSLVTPESLKDPWGRPYQYDREGKYNSKRKPDIWTTDPADAKTLYGNWLEK